MRICKQKTKAGTSITWRSRMLGLTIAGLLTLTGAGHAEGPNGIISGKLVVEPPTLIALGFEWYIAGDANRDGSVAVAYRKQGTEPWKDFLPLLRLQNEYLGSRERHLSWHAPNAFVGSIFDLEPDTAYEVRLTLSDPDGVIGETVKLVTVRTRPEPMPATDGRVYHVYPWGYKGKKEEPSFQGLHRAYFTGGGGGDRYNAWPVRVQPGDVILMHAGVYGDTDRLMYTGDRCCDNTWDGTYYLTAKGTAERPIVIKDAGDGEVIFDGYGNAVLFNMMGSAYNYFEGITFRNTEIAMLTGFKDIAGAVGLTIKHSKFEDVGLAIHGDWQGSHSFYIVDNDFQGRNAAIDGRQMTAFPRPEITPNGSPLYAISQYAIKYYGSGNVIAYNRIRDVHDGVTHAAFGQPDPAYILPVANDVYNNDVAFLHDDCVETDGASYNYRILRNKCVNVNEGFSSQPTFGGPAYAVRNVVYIPPAASGAFKTFDSQGWMIFNNTFVTDARMRGGTDANSHLRNNLFLAQNPTRPVFEWRVITSYATSDYNGFMPGAKAAPAPFVLFWPKPGTTVEYDEKKLQSLQLKTLDELRKATGREMHSLMVDYSVFQNLQPGDANNLTKVYDLDKIDFSLNPTGAAIDAGVVLAHITDGFAGKGPDLGAYELGQPIPHYGPRPRTR